MMTFTLAGGCFWCLDGVFEKLKGVGEVVSGYSGGTTPEPSYQAVCSGATGHAEAVQFSFDEQILPASVLLDIYFLIHNPTTLNRQGNDVGSQYRSVMFYEGNWQKILFNQALSRSKKVWGDNIVTEVVPLDKFYPADISHQDYYANNPAAPYCSIVIEPKIIKARSKYAKWMN